MNQQPNPKLQIYLETVLCETFYTSIAKLWSMSFVDNNIMLQCEKIEHIW